jgi:hypothetical protein
VLLASGCALGGTQNYAEVVPALTVSGTGKLAVATHDQRPYITSGNTAPTFVGLVRGGYGNPFQVQTASGRALADDMTQVMCKALRDKGFDCVPVLLAPSDTPEEVQRKLPGAASNLALLLVLREWKSDTYINTDLTYDVTLSVLNRRGAVLATVPSKGVENLGGGFNAPGHARTAIPLAFKKRLEELLNHPEVVAALQAANRS